MPVLVAVVAVHSRSRLLKLLVPRALGVATVPLLGTGFTSVRSCTFPKSTSSTTVSRKTHNLVCFSIKVGDSGSWIASEKVVHMQVEVGVPYCIRV